MQLKLVSWNVHELNERGKCESITYLLHYNRGNMLWYWKSLAPFQLWQDQSHWSSQHNPTQLIIDGHIIKQFNKKIKKLLSLFTVLLTLPKRIFCGFISPQTIACSWKMCRYTNPFATSRKILTVSSHDNAVNGNTLFIAKKKKLIHKQTNYSFLFIQHKCIIVKNNIIVGISDPLLGINPPIDHS